MVLKKKKKSNQSGFLVFFLIQACALSIDFFITIIIIAIIIAVVIIIAVIVAITIANTIAIIIAIITIRIILLPQTEQGMKRHFLPTSSACTRKSCHTHSPFLRRGRKYLDCGHGQQQGAHYVPFLFFL